MKMKESIMAVWLSMVLIVGIVEVGHALPVHPATIPFFSADFDRDSTAREEMRLFFPLEIKEPFNFGLPVDVHFEFNTIEKPSPKHPMPTGVAGVKIYIDPETGQIITPPEEVKVRERRIKLSPKMQNALSTSSEGLTIRKSEIPGGGYIIDLKGRFQQSTVVTIKPNGTVKKH